MKKNINIVLKDYRDSFHEPHKKKPYYLFIQNGEKCFYFSNKVKANRFLSSFKKQSTLLYKELNNHLKNSYAYLLDLCQILDFAKYQSICNELNFLSLRYAKTLKIKNADSICIGREIDIIYYQLDDFYIYFKKVLQKNNRSNVCLENVNFSIKNIRRLRLDFNALLQDADGINNIINVDSKSVKYEHFLKIA